MNPLSAKGFWELDALAMRAKRIAAEGGGGEVTLDVNMGTEASRKGQEKWVSGCEDGSRRTVMLVQVKQRAAELRARAPYWVSEAKDSKSNWQCTWEMEPWLCTSNERRGRWLKRYRSKKWPVKCWRIVLWNHQLKAKRWAELCEVLRRKQKTKQTKETLRSFINPWLLFGSPSSKTAPQNWKRDKPTGRMLYGLARLLWRRLLDQNPCLGAEVMDVGSDYSLILTGQILGDTCQNCLPVRIKQQEEVIF